MNRKLLYFHLFITILTFTLHVFFFSGRALAIEPDEYEVDDTYSQANKILISEPDAQAHNFHDTRDPDWVKFYSIAGHTYSIQTSNVGSNCDTVIEIYGSDGTTLLDKCDDYGKGEGEYYDVRKNIGDRNGIYYLKVYDYDEAYGANTEYDLRVYTPYASSQGFLTGTVTDVDSGEEIENASVSADWGTSDLTSRSGSYSIFGVAGTYIYTVQATGYHMISKNITVVEGQRTFFDFQLSKDTSNVGTGRSEGFVYDKDNIYKYPRSLVSIQNQSTKKTERFFTRPPDLADDNLNFGYIFPTLISGTYSIHVESTGYISADTTIIIDETSGSSAPMDRGSSVVLKNFTLESSLAAGTLFGKIINNEDKTVLIEDATVTISLSEEETWSSKTGVEGFYVFMNLRSGIYDISVTADGYQNIEKGEVSVGVGINEVERHFYLVPPLSSTTTTSTIPPTTSTSTSTTSTIPPTTSTSTSTTSTIPPTTSTSTSTTSTIPPTTSTSTSTTSTIPPTTSTSTSTTTISTSTTSSTTTTIDPCHNCNGVDVILQGVTFSGSANCDCIATRSISIGSGVVVEKGAKIRFRAPKVIIHPKFNAKTGSEVSIRQE